MQNFAQALRWLLGLALFLLPTPQLFCHAMFQPQPIPMTRWVAFILPGLLLALSGRAIADSSTHFGLSEQPHEPLSARQGGVLSTLSTTSLSTTSLSPHPSPAIAQRSARQEFQRRTALVIGNADYQSTPLLNPVNDATDITAALRKLGFEVTLLTNATLPQIEDALDNFNLMLRQGGVGLFYFAGHGVQVNGENYLIPLQARLKREKDVRYNALAVGRILAAMEDARNEANIIILDACRNNPFTRQWRAFQQGLAPVQAIRGALIAYATEPNGVAQDGSGRNGIYTSYLLRHITTPDLSVELMFKAVRADVVKATNEQQFPWDSSSLIGSFSFNPSIDDTQIAIRDSESPKTVSQSTPQPPSPASTIDRADPSSATTTSPAEESVSSSSADVDWEEFPDSLPGLSSKLEQLDTQLDQLEELRPPKDRLIAFAAAPRLLPLGNTQLQADSRAGAYSFTIQHPAGAGSPIQRVVLERVRGVGNFERFHEEETSAYQGSYQGSDSEKGSEIPLGTVNFAPEQNKVTLTFNPPIAPGETFTLRLKPVFTPRTTGRVIWSVTVFPEGENVQRMHLGKREFHIRRT